MRYFFLAGISLLALLTTKIQSGEFPEWRSIGPHGGSARVLVLDQQKPATMFALAMRGSMVYRSLDGASNWEYLRSFPRLREARLDAGLIVHDPKPVWLVGAAPGGLLRSEDEGQNWQVVPGTEKLSIYALGAWPKDEQVLAAGTDQGVWLSHDGGRRWRRSSPAANRAMAAIVSVAFDPAKAGTIFAGTPHLPWKSVDGGQTWKQIASGMFDDSDIFSIVVDPNQAGRVFASACSGIYRSLNAGLAWQRVQGIPGTNRRTYVVRQSPHNASLLFAGTSAGMWQSTDGGSKWRKQNSMVATSITFHPREAQVLYISTERHGLLRSNDGGESFEAVNLGFTSRRMEAVLSEPATRELMALANYEGAGAALFVATKPGGAWERKETAYNFAELQATGALLKGRSMDGEWLQSGDKGQNWTKVNNAAPGAMAAKPKSLPAHAFGWSQNPHLTSQWLAATSEGLSLSVDEGKNWQHVDKGLGPGWIDSVVFHAKQRELCFALRGQRVFWSRDGGRSWYWLPAKEEADVVFRKLQTVPEWPDLLFAIHESRGLFVYDLSENPLN